MTTGTVNNRRNLITLDGLNEIFADETFADSQIKAIERHPQLDFYQTQVGEEVIQDKTLKGLAVKVIAALINPGDDT